MAIRLSEDVLSEETALVLMSYSLLSSGPWWPTVIKRRALEPRGLRGPVAGWCALDRERSSMSLRPPCGFVKALRDGGRLINRQDFMRWGVGSHLRMRS